MSEKFLKVEDLVVEYRTGGKVVQIGRAHV